MTAHKYGKLFPAILADPDFEQLAPDVQNLYKSLLAEPYINAAGVLELSIGKWSTYSVHTTEDDIRRQLSELESRRFVITDVATFEALVRGYIRWDILELGSSWKTQKGVIAATLRTKSAKLRHTLADELERRLDLFRPEVLDDARANIAILRNARSIPYRTGIDRASNSNSNSDSNSNSCNQGGGATIESAPESGEPQSERETFDERVGDGQPAARQPAASEYEIPGGEEAERLQRLGDRNVRQMWEREL